MSHESLIEVAVDCNIQGVFTYSCGFPVAIGMRVVVPFGAQNRKKLGVVVRLDVPKGEFAVKAVADVVDQEPVFSPHMMLLAKWLSDYYLFPLGAVLRVMLPAGTRVKVKFYWSLTPKGLSAWEQKDRLIRAIFNKRTPLLESTFRNKLKTLPADITPPGVRNLEKSLVNDQLVQREERSSLTKEASAPLSPKSVQTASKPKTLNGQQAEALRRILEGGLLAPIRKPFLLWGVTGSGKTEVYLQLIHQLFQIDLQAQVLVMVPEISLTPQMTMVFEDRFPDLVAVVHSAMDADKRWQQLELIRQNQRRILVGPRSAVFGPFSNLKLIIVDEEHDGSYKQSSGFHYNGRDVAVLRGKIESATVVMGSATPSIETYANALEGKYELVRMPERAMGGSLPPVEIVPFNPSRRRGQSIKGVFEDCDIPLHPGILSKLDDVIKAGRQAMVIVNRRGFAYFLLSRQDNSAVACPHCSVSLTVHRKTRSLKCHYCEYTESLQTYLQSQQDYLVVGYGSEQVEAYLQSQLPNARVVRVDSDTVSARGALEKVLGDFRKGAVDILVGTQILAKGHDFPNVTLICLLEVDQMLNLPDFRAGERTFQLMVQASGRAGRSQLKGEVLLQTQKPGDEIIRSAVEHDFAAFAEREIKFRKDHHFPPYSKMIHIEFNGKKPDVLDTFLHKVSGMISRVYAEQAELRGKVTVLGPTVPPIEMVRGRVRRSIILSSPEQGVLWRLAHYIQKNCARLPSDVRMKLDVDPQSIL